MAVSTIGVADAASPDKYLHTWQRTISGTAREDQFIQHGWSGYPTYSIEIAPNASAGTAHVLQVMGDGTNYSRLVAVTVTPLYASSAGIQSIGIYRLSSAGTGGGTATVAAYDSADTYAGAAQTLPSSKGTVGALLKEWTAYYPVINSPMYALEWRLTPGAKPIVFGTATSDGIAVIATEAITGAVVRVSVEFVVTPYL